MMLVTIFSGPGDKFRVRELAPGSIQAQTMKWADDYDGALSFIDERYSSNEFVDDETFRDEVKRRRGGKAMENLETMKQRWSTVSAEDYKRMDEQ